MESKTMSQEYEFSESEDSPLKPYQSLSKVLKRNEETSQHLECWHETFDHDVEDNSLNFKDNADASIYSGFVRDIKDNELKKVENDESKIPVSQSAKSTDNLKSKLALNPLKRNVVYVCSRDLVQKCDQMLKIPNRVHAFFLL